MSPTVIWVSTLLSSPGRTEAEEYRGQINEDINPGAKVLDLRRLSGNPISQDPDSLLLLSKLQGPLSGFSK